MSPLTAVRLAVVDEVKFQGISGLHIKERKETNSSNFTNSMTMFGVMHRHFMPFLGLYRSREA